MVIVKDISLGIKKIFAVLDKNQKLFGVLVLICGIIAAVFETLGVSVILPLINVIIDPNLLMTNRYINYAVLFLGIKNSSGIINMVIVSVIVLYFFKNIYLTIYAWVKQKYACKVQREIGIYMLQSYMNRGYSYFLMHSVNDALNGTCNDVTCLYAMITGLLQVVTQLMTIMMIFIFLCLSDFMLAVGVMVAGGVCTILNILYFKQKMYEAGEKRRHYNLTAYQVLIQTFTGIKEVIVSRKQKFFRDQYEKNTILNQREMVKLAVGAETPAYIIETVSVAGIMILLLFKLLNSDDTSELIATLATFSVGVFRIMPALGKISNSVNAIVSNVPGVSSVYENIIEARLNNDVFYDVEIQDQFEIKNAGFNKSIELCEISFRYQEKLGNVLEKLSFSIPKGKSVALVGESGAGKSTLADILLGVLPPDEGAVYMDGINIRDIPILWSKIVGYVPQTIFLYDTTIRENIGFGYSKDEIDDEQIRLALKKANLLEFVESLPDGLNTFVGDRGVRLSGGQRQRIGIARALYHNPEILILDEATSALDNETEECVMESIDSLHGQMTMLIIAHRLTTVQNCDIIYEVVNGNIEHRTYEQIINKKSSINIGNLQ